MYICTYMLVVSFHCNTSLHQPPQTTAIALSGSSTDFVEWVGEPNWLLLCYAVQLYSATIWVQGDATSAARNSQETANADRGIRSGKTSRGLHDSVKQYKHLKGFSKLCPSVRVCTSHFVFLPPLPEYSFITMHIQFISYRYIWKILKE